MLDLIFLSPLLFVVVGALIVRFAIRKKPFSWLGWTCSIVALSGAVLLPLTQGVWIPDFIGSSRTLGRETSSTGSRFEVVQYWNHVDFYTTEVRVTTPDGNTSVVVVDADANRNRSAVILLDESARTAKVVVDGMGYPAFDW